MTKELFKARVDEWNAEHESEGFKLTGFYEDNPAIRLDKNIFSGDSKYREYYRVFNGIFDKNTNEFIDVFPQISELYWQLRQRGDKRILVWAGDHYSSDVEVYDVSTDQNLFNAINKLWGNYGDCVSDKEVPEPVCEFTEEDIATYPEVMQNSARKLFENYKREKKEWDNQKEVRELIPKALKGDVIARMKLLINHGKDLFDLTLSLGYSTVIGNDLNPDGLDKTWTQSF